MDVLGSASQVLLNLSLTQKKEQTDIRALASGLRVSSAVDDPSGYGIAQRLQTQVNGFQQAAQNVQTANNALAVANGALTTITLILQRIRSLVVESRSDLNSSTDLANIQAEISQLLLEVNRISSNTSFNGLNLLDGQFQTTPLYSPASGNGLGYGAYQVTSPFLSPNGSIPTSTVTNADGLGNPGPLVTLYGPGGVSGPGNFTANFIVFQVTGYSANAIDPDTGINVGPGVFVQVQSYSSNPEFGAAPLMQDTTAVPVNSGVLSGITEATPASFSGPVSSELLQFNLANLTQQDVGATIAFQVVPQSASQTTSNSPLYVQDGPQEGQTTAISLPGVSTSDLNISNISVLAPQTVSIFNQVTGQSSSNNISAADAETRVDAALTAITQAQAQIGAQMVSLNYDATNANTAAMNLTASVSSIQDANIGATVTDLTQQQILTQIGSSVLAQMQVSATQITALMLNGIGIGYGGGGAASIA